MDASEQLLDLILLGLEHGTGSIESGGALVPFLLMESGAGGRSLKRFLADKLERSLAEARTHLAGLTDVERVALAYDGYVTIEDQRTDAILVEAQDAGRRNCLVFAQRYRPGGRLRKLSAIGKPVFLGDGDPLF
jgi:hypothetical protein